MELYKEFSGYVWCGVFSNIYILKADNMLNRELFGDEVKFSNKN